MLRRVRSIAGVLFGLLLFLQFGNEWALAGWLPLFLIHRLGVNPVWAMLALAGYFLALMMGRLVARKLLGAMSHRKLLLIAISLAMAGYLLLGFTGSMAWVWVAIVLLGAGFAPIYPIVAETLDERFAYHPGFYNNVFSLAITGAMSTPWLLGYVDAAWGTQAVMLVPAFGSIGVVILVILVLFESHLLTGKKSRATAAGGGFGT